MAVSTTTEVIDWETGEEHERATWDEVNDFANPYFVWAENEEEAKKSFADWVKRNFELDGKELAPVMIVGVATDIEVIPDEHFYQKVGLGDNFRVTIVKKLNVGAIQILNNPLDGLFVDERYKEHEEIEVSSRLYP